MDVERGSHDGKAPLRPDDPPLALGGGPYSRASMDDDGPPTSLPNGVTACRPLGAREWGKGNAPIALRHPTGDLAYEMPAGTDACGYDRVSDV